MFSCHINVELCVSRVDGIKYLFKYVCKGHDRVTMEIIGENQRYDEITHFQDARYISACEGAWRILGFDLVDTKPVVVRLDYTLKTDTLCVSKKAMKGRRQPVGLLEQRWQNCSKRKKNILALGT